MSALNELIHQPTRLRIMAALSALAPGAEVEFAYLRELLGLTDGNLGAHLLKLEEAGYVRSRKAFVGRKPRTYLALTPLGQHAFAEHLAALRAILAPDLNGPEGRGEEVGDGAGHPR
ncbi:winged helix-turn-helix domain-containing protein [Thermus islandicus]|uniref:winged helix-turn-helix domain-containing protein n=1 Tax=Thermus islandicus TaxID=540988 RepID=UPI0003B3B19F|nr:transcriptional regulator [Thermus islandicus]